MSQIVRCTELSKRYGNITALNNISFTLESGKIIGLLGPNGSGKTTLIKLLNGLLTPSQGEILIGDHKIGVETKKRVAYLPDNSYLNSWMTVQQIVGYFTDFYEDFRPAVAYEMLDIVCYNIQTSLLFFSNVGLSILYKRPFCLGNFFSHVLIRIIYSFGYGFV